MTIELNNFQKAVITIDAGKVIVTYKRNTKHLIISKIYQSNFYNYVMNLKVWSFQIYIILMIICDIKLKYCI